LVGIVTIYWTIHTTGTNENGSEPLIEFQRNLDGKSRVTGYGLPEQRHDKEQVELYAEVGRLTGSSDIANVHLIFAVLHEPGVSDG